MARPLKGSGGNSPGPHPQVPRTGLSHQDDHVDISAGMGAEDAKTSKAGGGSRPGIANGVNRSGRGMKASQPNQVVSKANPNDPRVS